MTELIEFELWGLPATIQREDNGTEEWSHQQQMLIKVGEHTISSSFIGGSKKTIRSHMENLARLLSEKGILVIHERRGRRESERYDQFPYSYAHCYKGVYTIHNAYSKNSHFETAEELVKHLSKNAVLFKPKLD